MSSLSPSPQGQHLVYHMYLSKEKLKTVPPKDLQVFFHILRMVNSLRSTMKLHVKLKTDSDKMESFKDRMEIHFLSIAMFYEALKTLVKVLLPRMTETYISESRLAELRQLADRFANKRNDPFLRVAAAIRNKIVFHFDSEVVDRIVTEGSPTKDLLIGYARGRTINDSVYLEPSTAFFMYLAPLCPENTDAKDTVDWIQKTSITEIDSFCRLLERTAGDFFKKNGKLVQGPPLLE